MTASMAEVVLCSALLSAMALWYGVRMGAVPLSRRLAAMAIPLTQACALVAFGAFAMPRSLSGSICSLRCFRHGSVSGGRWSRTAEPFAGCAQGVGPGSGPCGS